MFFYILIGLVLAFPAYVRVAPSDPNRWHVAIAAETESNLAGGAVRIIPNGPETLTILNKNMLLVNLLNIFKICKFYLNKIKNQLEKNIQLKANY